MDLRLLFGRSNPFKEGDAHIGVAARNEAERLAARAELRGLRIGDLRSALFVDDEVSAALEATIDRSVAERISAWTVEEFAAFLLAHPEPDIHSIMPGLSSEAIAAAVKLMSNAELTLLSAKVFNPPLGSTIGARDYLGSRIQPNSPTDDPEEVLFSVLEGLSYGCGDVVLGINPVASDWRNVASLERTLREVVRTFELSDATTYCVLAHIDDQLEAHDNDGADGGDGAPLVECGFQSIGGTATANRTFNFDLRKLLAHLRRLCRQYFETGQGSECTNGCANGIDMVTLEARSYGVARALALQTGNWTIVNDVSGFIGPEVFATAAQLERACLEDLVMGKLHGLVMGLDICSTMHMGVSVEELDSVTDTLLHARPAYLMAVAGKSDPMLSYITTSFRDHARLRLSHGLRVSDAMAAFFARVGVMEADGLGRTMTARAGDTSHLYVQLLRARGDGRSELELRSEAAAILRKLQGRGLDLGYGHDGAFNAPPAVHAALLRNYEEAKRVLKVPLSLAFLATVRARGALLLESRAHDRKSYVSHPSLGEQLSEPSLRALRDHAAASAARRTEDSAARAVRCEVALVLSDGLNAEAVDSEAARQFEAGVRAELAARGIGCDPTLYVVDRGRVRAGYEVGRELFAPNELKGRMQAPPAAGTMLGEADTPRTGPAQAQPAGPLFATVHIVGERPGNGQNTFSAYCAIAPRARWAAGVNHDSCRVVSGISASATRPASAIAQALAILVSGLRPSVGA